MGSLIHIAEVAALIFAAYMVGWLIGYVLHRAVARPVKTATVAAEADAAGAATLPVDALVKAPIVVPVAGAPPPHVHAKVTQIEPATAVAVPDGMVLADVKAIETLKAPAAPVSAVEALKSLATALPLARVEVVPLTTISEAIASTQAAEPDIPAPAELQPPLPTTEPLPTDSEPVGAAENVAAQDAVVVVLSEPAAPSQPTDEAFAAAAPAPTAASVAPAAADALVPPDPVAAPSASVAKSEPVAEPERLVVSEPDRTEPEPVSPPAMPSSRPGVAWSGAIKGREASPFERAAEVSSEAADESEEPEQAGLDVTLLDSLADELQVDEPALPIDQLDALALPTVKPEPIAAAEMPAPAEEPAPPNEAIVEAQAAAPEPVPALAGVPQQEFDEDAAMRAIEGGWSRRQTRAMSDAYELTDVSAAVSAAQMAVEQVLAANGIDPAEQGMRAQAAFGKPRGLPQPRNGRRDNLKQINGLGPLDESTLNNLGVYHFDQIAAWDQKEVLWMENHAFARGRIGREDWQGQAKALIDEEAARRAGS